MNQRYFDNHHPIQSVATEYQHELAEQTEKVRRLKIELEWAERTEFELAGRLANYVQDSDPDHRPLWLQCPCCGNPRKVTDPERTAAFIAKHWFVSVCEDCA